MTFEANSNPMTTDDDLKTTVPNIRADDWKMPDPVFRKTSGRLPESFIRKPEPVTAAEPETVVDAPAPSSPEPKPKNPALKIVIVALAITAMIAFIAVFLTVVYFMFLR
jgi:hypothetical protein